MTVLLCLERFGLVEVHVMQTIVCHKVTIFVSFGMKKGT